MKHLLIIIVALATFTCVAKPKHDGKDTHPGPRPKPPTHEHHRHHRNDGSFILGVLTGTALNQYVNPVRYGANVAPVVTTPQPIVNYQHMPTIMTTPPQPKKFIFIPGHYTAHPQPDGSVIQVWSPPEYRPALNY